ncbi:MAG: hypothetical protein ACJAZ0_002318 [Halioglobus sp.]|jgi:trans-2-enoyl-CoA reductase
MLQVKAEHQTPGPIPQDVIEAVPFKKPVLEEDQVLLEMLQRRLIPPMP